MRLTVVDDIFLVLANVFECFYTNPETSQNQEHLFKFQVTALSKWSMMYIDEIVHPAVNKGSGKETEYVSCKHSALI